MLNYCSINLINKKLKITGLIKCIAPLIILCGIFKHTGFGVIHLTEMQIFTLPNSLRNLHFLWPAPLLLIATHEKYQPLPPTH